MARLRRAKEWLSVGGVLEWLGQRVGLRRLRAVSGEKIKAMLTVAQLTAVFTKKENLGGKFPKASQTRLVTM